MLGHTLILKAPYRGKPPYMHKVTAVMNKVSNFPTHNTHLNNSTNYLKFPKPRPIQRRRYRAESLSRTLNRVLVVDSRSPIRGVWGKGRIPVDTNRGPT